MALTATFDIEITFDLTGTIPRFIFKDINDYFSDGDSLVGGSLTVTSPANQVIFQTPAGSYSITSAQLSFDSLLIPTDLQGHIITGQYTFQYTAITTNHPNGYTKKKLFGYQFCSPKVVIETTIDCFIARMVSRDITAYAVQGVTPTMVRVHEVHFPSILNLSHLSNNSELHHVNHPNLFEGTYTTKISVELNYDFKQLIYIKTKSSAQKDTHVQCDLNLCKIYCCVKALKKRTDALRCENRNSFMLQKQILLEVTGLMILFEQASRCGQTADADQYLKQIKERTNCGGSGSDSGDDCNCGKKSGNKPQQIKPFLNAATSSSTNKWMGGTGGPSSLLGNDKDYYINHSNGDIYLKAGGTWTVQLNINGQGVPGQNGATWHSGNGIPTPVLGSNNDYFLSLTTSDVYKKTTGVWGSPIANLKGLQGPQGIGIQGPQGPPGIAGTTLFSGFIAMYSGSLFDFNGSGLGLYGLTGWALCNGNNNTPDLRGRFIVGYNELSRDYNTIGKVGGASQVTLTKNQSGMPAHSHSHNISANSDNAGAHAHVGYEWRNNANLGSGGSSASSNKSRTSYTTSTNGEHKHQINIAGEIQRNEGINAANPHENRPPYYTLAFIMKI